MIYRCRILMALLILSLSLGACSASNSELMKSESNQKPVNVIVLMPVENKTKDERLQRLLSARLMEELRFKGYPQTAVAADAALHCTLQESKSSKALFYAPATVSVRCELRSTKTGETIWNAQHRSTSRSFDVMNSTLKSNGALESALEEVVGKVMETLPYGPMLRG